MKLVIDIPKEVYNCVIDGTYCGTLYDELKNGVPFAPEINWISCRDRLPEVGRRVLITYNYDGTVDFAHLYKRYFDYKKFDIVWLADDGRYYKLEEVDAWAELPAGYKPGAADDRARQQTATDIIEEVKEAMCSDYCRYPREYNPEENNDLDLWDTEICAGCPLNRL